MNSNPGSCQDPGCTREDVYRIGYRWPVRRGPNNLHGHPQA